MEVDPPSLLTFLIKVTARCDLACDYCYVFEHADQTWRDRPGRMPVSIQRMVAARIGEYARETGLTDIEIIFHGGEPLLLGAPRLAEFAAHIRSELPEECRPSFGLQTNGLRLDRAAIATLSEANIAISVSLDGGRMANDRHRLTVNGSSSFAPTISAIQTLKSMEAPFVGVIAVIDPANDPRDLLRFFHDLDIPQLDLLLPDATHDNPPLGRSSDSDLYTRWLIQAFDAWFDEFGSIPVRTFDALVGAVAGAPSTTDAFGLGDVSLLTIESDGTYHDLDVFKIAAPHASAIGGDVSTQTVSEAAASEQIAYHRRLLKREGLSSTCQRCPELQVCGGGAVPHRYGKGHYKNPSVYCDELKALISHVRHRVTERLVSRSDTRYVQFDETALAQFEAATTGTAIVADLRRAWLSDQQSELQKALESASTNEPAAAELVQLSASEGLGDLSIRPSAALWARAMNAANSGRVVVDLHGQELPSDAAYASELRSLALRPRHGWPDIHRDDRWLRLPFGYPIEFEPQLTPTDLRTLEEAFGLIERYSAAVAAELRLLCPDVQLVRDRSAHGSKVVSFSDDLVPGAIYVAMRTAEGHVGPVDVADSILHEYRHQKLYLLERSVRLVVDDTVRVNSPWRSDLRPPSGLLHACFVFVELRRFWRWAAASGDAPVARATTEIEATDDRLARALKTLSRVDLTPAGRGLLQVLRRRFELESECVQTVPIG